jgi:tetratricopeptide (TPR) repeat protein
MTAKFSKLLAATLGLAMAFSIAAIVSGASQYGGYSQGSSGATQSATPAQDNKEKGEKKEKVNKAEEAAYKNVLAAQGGDPAAEIPVSEDFIAKFPTSRYIGGVYGMLTTAYFSTGNTDKMFATGAKALELNPDNVPRRAKANMPDYQDQIKKAEVYARHAIELMPSLPKPPTVDDATFEKAKNDKLALAHSGLGLISLNVKKNYDDARAELTQAVTLASSPDMVDYYLLGNADSKASFLNGAIAAFDKCASSGPLINQCKSGEDSAKKDVASGTKLSRD